MYTKETNDIQPSALKQAAKEAAFTLIELSIVLVIIGLIVGGVLVGQDLIKAAEIRATVGQIEKYNSAVNTFRTKFNGIPGDIVGTQALAFGLLNTGGASAGAGDGNGLIEDNASGVGAIDGAGESLLFWRHLSDASLVDGSLGAGTSIATTSTTLLPVATVVATYFPLAKMGRGNYITVGSDSGLNYYVIGGLASMTTGGVLTYALDMTPIEAYNIDIKVDDGQPNTGIVQARGAVASAVGALSTVNASLSTTTMTGVSGDCTVDATSATDTAATYNRNLSGGGTTQACMLRYRFN